MKKILIIILALITITSINAQDFENQNFEKLKDMFIIVLDIQTGYTQSTKLKKSATKMITYVNSVIENADANNVIYIKSSHKLLNLSLSRPFIYTTIDSTAIWDLDSRLKIINENIFKKEKNDAFTIQKLRCFLDDNKAKKIIVVGLLAEQCIFETLYGAKELGYEMYVIPEAVIGKSEKSKRKMIRYFKKEGINILQLKNH
ncbi:MAG: hypothetical protein B6I20_07315 [Bacteroidetes bacterium 4572_117]|nr:MAG: hypothetical protein B6I20_07315 [Bacteroidetes bacterium 4572_117]